MKSKDDWFLKMSVTQRGNHIKRVANTTVQPKKPTKGKCKLSATLYLEYNPSQRKLLKCINRGLGDGSSLLPFTSKEVAQLQESSVGQHLSAGPSQASRDPITTEESVLSVSVKYFCYCSRARIRGHLEESSRTVKRSRGNSSSTWWYWFLSQIEFSSSPSPRYCEEKWAILL